MTFSDQNIQEFDKLVNSASSILITSHKSPDGDSIGSSLGLFHYLSLIHNNVSICHPDDAPYFLKWIEGFDKILTLDSNQKEVEQKFDEADLIFCLDYNGAGRIGKMEDLLINSEAKKIMIDHHRDPDTELCDLMFSDYTICSTSQMICELIEAKNDISSINRLIGTPLYCGIVTDTGSFRFSSTTPKTHEIIAILLRQGVKHYEIHENIFDSDSLDKIKLWSYALLEKLVVQKKYSTAYISLSMDEEKRFNAIKGDTEGLVNRALGIDGVKMAVFFKESDGIIKISFRSKANIPVNNIARENFEGGGHLNASGGKFVGKLEDAIHKFEKLLPYFYEINQAEFE